MKTEYIYPMKYLKTEWGLIALVLAKIEGNEYQKIHLSEDVHAEVFSDGLMGVVCGEVVLPIPSHLLDFVIQNPKIQISVVTDRMIDDDHTLVELNLPALYELKGVWKASLRNQSSLPANALPSEP